ncbi:hypothetical protein SAMN06309944_1090 [Micrococcales bacterium KH10]|nr:hypothetical protein SAMN06309944_1090 [Micrococcales bacterium KH10]
MSQVANRHDALDVVGAQWQAVSPRLVTLRRLSLSIVLVPAIVVLVIVLAVTQMWWPGLVAAALLVLWLLACVLIGRQVRAIRYARRDDDLVIRKGVLARRLVVIPYGRMQTVDVSVGPLERRFGLASLQFQTASASTNATLPGLVATEAQSVREELVRLGEKRMRRL